MLPRISPRAGQLAEALLKRVIREARAAARLNHPGIITIHDVVEHHGAPVIVMEFVAGRSLAAEIRENGWLPVPRVAEIGAAVLDALAAAHAAGVVHRDVKPDNILLAGRRVVLTDFGIAGVADRTTALTGTGMAMGTPTYLAPEQLDGKPATAASDPWSLGATPKGQVISHLLALADRHLRQSCRRVRGRRLGRRSGAAGSSHSPDHATDSVTRS
ncbi:serine/threonine-protein kinase [Streptomyces lydicus]|uniref:serine/threonine-protein kinase n=1 Tax=Streptomyces lydicus TaxID=47763 RepID=UPI0036F6D131